MTIEDQSEDVLHTWSVDGILTNSSEWSRIQNVFEAAVSLPRLRLLTTLSRVMHGLCCSSFMALATCSSTRWWWDPAGRRVCFDCRQTHLELNRAVRCCLQPTLDGCHLHAAKQKPGLSPLPTPWRESWGGLQLELAAARRQCNGGSSRLRGVACGSRADGESTPSAVVTSVSVAGRGIPGVFLRRKLARWCLSEHRLCSGAGCGHLCASRRYGHCPSTL